MFIGGFGVARIAVIGAGIVGLSCAFHLRRDGHAVTVFDPDPDGDKCSWGNAGGIAVTEILPAAMPGAIWRVPGWLLDPLGPLSLRPAQAPKMIPWFLAFLRAAKPERAARIAADMAGLLGRAHDDLLPVLAATGMAGKLHRDGNLTVYRSLAALEAERHEWDIRRRHGIECVEMTGDEARAMEPALSADIAAGVYCPAWSQVEDPKEIWGGLLAFLRAGGTVFRAAGVMALPGAGVVALRGGAVEAGFDRIVLAAGAWSARLAVTMGERVLLESERGYNTTIAQPGISIGREIVFAERKFVAAPLSIGLRIGGAADFAGLEAPANYARSRKLAMLAKEYLPGLATTEGKDWMGNRPATPDSLPVIGVSPVRGDVIHAFGHGHLGLTLSATTGALVADVVAGRATGLDISPFSSGRFR